MLIDKYQFCRDKCWYKNACSMYNKEPCRMNCPRYLQMYYLFNQAGIPEVMQYPSPLYPDKQDYAQFVRLSEIKNDIVNWVNSGNNLYIFSSTCGNGKTSWAIKLMSKYFDCVWPGNGYECRGLFIRCGQLFNRAKRNISSKDSKWEEYLQAIRECDLVIWDDIGEYQLSLYDQQLLIELIDDRIYSGKANIYTSNVIDEVLECNIGKRLTSRVLNNSEVIEFIGGDRRGE